MLFERTIESRSSEAAAAGSDDSALVLRAKALDGDAWEEIFHAHYQRLCTFLHYRVGNASAAEDLASQVFVEAIAGIARYEYRGIPLRAWLFRIARNVSSDYLRRETRSAQAVREAPSESSHDQTPLRLLERDWEERQLMAALEQLTAEQRQVVVLRFIDELSTAETAQIIGKSVGATKALQHRALGRMRRVLSSIESVDR